MGLDADQESVREAHPGIRVVKQIPGQQTEWRKVVALKGAALFEVEVVKDMAGYVITVRDRNGRKQFQKFADDSTYEEILTGVLTEYGLAALGLARG